MNLPADHVLKQLPAPYALLLGVAPEIRGEEDRVGLDTGICRTLRPLDRVASATSSSSRFCPACLLGMGASGNQTAMRSAYQATPQG